MKNDDVISTEINSDSLALLHSSEIDKQIATAHAYPRSISAFRRDVFDMVAISEVLA